MHSTVRHKVARYLTERPGSVVYRDDVVEATELSATQVTSAIRNLQQGSPLGTEIETVVSGNAWRYVPRFVTGGAASADVAPLPAPPPVNGRRPTRLRPDGSVPLTWQVREYLIARPGVVVSCDELAKNLDTEDYKIKVAVNNMRQSHQDVASYVETTVRGHSWRYAPPGVAVPSTDDDDDDDDDKSTTYYQPVKLTSATSATSASDVPRLFEEVGTTADGGVIVRDDDGALYHATKM